VKIQELKQQYAEGRRDFRETDLSQENLAWSNLIDVDLSEANYRKPISTVPI
jgi:uncharacterized protein YjbI with pentapeptide repeats